MKYLLLTCLLMLIAQVALPQDYSQGGSTWCLIRDEVETCNYSSQLICDEAALNVGGYCRQNPRKAGLRGDRDWCVVNSTGRFCNYYSQEQCLRDAARNNGGCVYNTERALEDSAYRKESAGLIAEELEKGGQRDLADQLKEAQAETSAQQEAAAAPGASGP
jgi:hypothetical protein